MIFEDSAAVNNKISISCGVTSFSVYTSKQTEQQYSVNKIITYRILGTRRTNLILSDTITSDGTHRARSPHLQSDGIGHI